MEEKRETVYNWYDFRMSNILKEGRMGSFEIKKKVIEKGTVLQMYNSKEGRIFKGEYHFDYPMVALLEDGHTWMSDSQIEIESIIGAICAARGDVLIGGLGIGLLPTFIKNKRDVKRIDIVEKHQEVIDLVFSQIKSPKMRIIKDDIYHYLGTTLNRYDFIHIDIWASITASIKEIDTIRDKAKLCLIPSGIVWCWLQELYDRIKEKLPKEPTFITSSIGIHEPCLICGKKLRNDYAGLCMDCADDMEVSELYLSSLVLEAEARRRNGG